MHTARNERQQQMHRFRTAVEAQLGPSAGPRKTGGPGKATALETSGRENRLRPLFSWPITRHPLVGPNGSATPMHWRAPRSEEHTSELQSLMRISYAVFCLKKNNTHTK